MSNNNKEIHYRSGSGCSTAIVALLTAMVGYHLHGSLFWAILDFFFWPIAIIKWIICQEVTLSIIKNTFPWFFQ